MAEQKIVISVLSKAVHSKHEISKAGFSIYSSALPCLSGN